MFQRIASSLSSTQSPPPLLVYDDTCNFCTLAAALAVRHSNVESVGFSELTPTQRARLPPCYEACAHLLTDDEVYFCGRAMEETLVQMYPVLDPLFTVARRLPYYPRLRETIYHYISKYRGLTG
ncbi:DCC1-like thiol-disulfide oxidoreductase family protein [Natrinema sp. 1APR25-10V2]|uniref:DCC1-like thiol-disulfide oxidoreductase family protein n=1 Tax=Natrinema sp. 1APR25-10V2 TaxID=2951081 RepID=UPI002876D8AA|nr:DCC1-like thiol-disulfide oxidoreductase family protein [Natrinema sp. 1APR25-10V2]MDS0474611.1 DUF393 domain-containing protein [Natrinema sp. 1APR25-10V2]